MWKKPAGITWTNTGVLFRNGTCKSLIGRNSPEYTKFQ